MNLNKYFIIIIILSLQSVLWGESKVFYLTVAPDITTSWFYLHTDLDNKGPGFRIKIGETYYKCFRYDDKEFFDSCLKKIYLALSSGTKVRSEIIPGEYYNTNIDKTRRKKRLFFYTVRKFIISVVNNKIIKLGYSPEIIKKEKFYDRADIYR